MRSPKWLLLVSLVAFLLINLSPMLASAQENPTNQDDTQNLAADYQTGKIVAIKSVEQLGRPIEHHGEAPVSWTTEFFVRISVQVKATVYTGEYVTEDQLMAPPAGWAVDRPIRVKVAAGKMFLGLANGGELVAHLR